MHLTVLCARNAGVPALTYASHEYNLHAMSDRVTGEQTQACLDIADTFIAEHYDQRAVPDDERDQNYTLYDFKLPVAKVPQLLLATMIESPFEGSVYADPMDAHIQRTIAFSDVHLVHDESLVIGFMRRFQTPEIRGYTALDYLFGFPDSEGVTNARVRHEISASRRNLAQEGHRAATERLIYHSQLDSRLRSADQEPSKKTAEYEAAVAYLEYLRANKVDINDHPALDMHLFLDAEAKERTRRRIPMDGAQADALHAFLGNLSLYKRQRHGYEELGERFGTDHEL